MLARRSATPQLRKVEAATVKNWEYVRSPSKKKIVKGTQIPITIRPMISRRPDTRAIQPQRQRARLSAGALNSAMLLSTRCL